MTIRKLFQEFYYWAYKWMVKADCGGAEGFFAILWLTITQICISLGFLSVVERLTGYNAIWVANLAPQLDFLGERWDNILNVLPIMFLFYWIDYKIIMYKTDRMKIIRHYVNLPKKRRKRGLILFWAYWGLSIFGSLIFMGLMRGDI